MLPDAHVVLPVLYVPVTASHLTQLSCGVPSLATALTPFRGLRESAGSKSRKGGEQRKLVHVDGADLSRTRRILVAVFICACVGIMMVVRRLRRWSF